MPPATTSAISPQSRQPLQTLTIAHAFGGLDGKAYLNCKEGFEHHYQHGFRYFEADLWLAQDGEIVFFHNGLEKRFGLRPRFTAREFMASPLEGKYSPLDLSDIARMMRDQPDWFLITDVKTDNEQALRMLCEALEREGVDCRERVIPEFYSFQEIDIIRRLHFRRSILGLYRMQFIRPGISGKLSILVGRNNGVTEEDVLHFVAHHPEVSAVSMPVHDWNRSFNGQLRQMGVQSFVHTINNAKKAQAFFHEKAGIFTDTLPCRVL